MKHLLSFDGLAYFMHLCIEEFVPLKVKWIRRIYYRKIYLKTSHWKRMRYKMGGICYICGQPGANQTHHLRYELWREKQKDLKRVHGGKCHEVADKERRKNKQW